MIVVTTPTGQIGKQVLENVMAGNEPVRVIARDPDALPGETIARESAGGAMRSRCEARTKLSSSATATK